MSNGDFWSANIWTQFNGVPGDKTQPGLLKATMGPIQVAQQVFNTIVTGNDNSIPADTINLNTGIPSTGETRSFATLRKAFKLFPVHVNDPALTMASNQVTLAGQALALVSEQLVYEGTGAQLPQQGEPPRFIVDLPDGDQAKLGTGLLGIATANPRVNPIISVHPRAADQPYGLQTYTAVVDGIAQFTRNQQGPPYALIVSPDIFADANFPLQNQALVTPSSAIQALLASGPFLMSPGMPRRTGLLASLGGKTTLYIGTGPLVEYNAFDSSVYSFTARESIQFLNTDARSLIKLQFEAAPGAAAPGAAAPRAVPHDE
jgi:hypothetical protein